MGSKEEKLARKTYEQKLTSSKDNEQEGDDVKDSDYIPEEEDE